MLPGAGEQRIVSGDSFILRGDAHPHAADLALVRNVA